MYIDINKKSLFLDLFIGILLNGDLLKLRFGNQVALELLNLGLRHLFPQLHHLLIHLAVLRLKLQNLFKTTIGLYFFLYIT